jgi:hypothetical protein
MVAPSSHPAFAWSIVGWLDFLGFVHETQKSGVLTMDDALVLPETGGCCARPVVDFFERLASRAFQKNQQQI